jgi:hypothetical protein
MKNKLSQSFDYRTSAFAKNFPPSIAFMQRVKARIKADEPRRDQVSFINRVRKEYQHVHDVARSRDRNSTALCVVQLNYSKVLRRHLRAVRAIEYLRKTPSEVVLSWENFNKWGMSGWGKPVELFHRPAWHWVKEVFENGNQDYVCVIPVDLVGDVLYIDTFLANPKTCPNVILEQIKGSFETFAEEIKNKKSILISCFPFTNMFDELFD